MHCVSCGSPFAEGTRFCPSCGTEQPAPPRTETIEAKPLPRTDFSAPSGESVPQLGAPVAPVVSGEPPTSNLAVVSLVAGIAAYFALPGISALVAIITGHLAKKEIREARGALGGSGFATAGLILGYAHFALLCIGLAVVMLIFGGIFAALGSAGS